MMSSIVMPSKESMEKEGISGFDAVGPPRLPAQAWKLIEQPHDHDVLFFRTSLSTSHPGSVRFRMLVSENRTDNETLERYAVDDGRIDIARVDDVSCLFESHITPA